MHWRTTRKKAGLLVSLLFFFTVVATLFTNSPPTFAKADIIDLSATGEQTYLGPYIKYLKDKEGTLDISRVSSPSMSDSFRSCHSISPGFGFSSSVFWFRFSLYNPTSQPLKRFLEIEYPLLDHVDLYIPEGNGNFRVYKEGDRQDFYKRPIKYRNFVFILRIQPKTHVDYFIRVQTSSSLNLPARLYTEVGFMDKIENEETALGIYFGILFAMLAYNLILFFTIRESVYLYYVLFVIFNFLFQLDLTGVAFKYLWPDSIYWANESLPFFIFVSYYFGTVFTRQIINSKKYAPLLDRILSVLAVISAVFAGCCLFFPYGISIKAATLVAMTVVVHILAGFLCLYRGYRPARYYAMAWSISMGGAAIYALKSFGILPNNFVTVWGIQIGSAWEVILLSMALSDRLSLLQKEKDQIQAKYTRKLEDANLRLEEFAKTLEEKVRQRTMEIERSNMLLKKQAEEMRLAEEMAERASEAKSDFLANMSHEIRTPLNAITGITALALEMDLPEKLRGYLKIIKASAHSLLNLVNDILDFSKIEAGRMELEKTNFMLMDVFENIAHMFTEIAAEKSIEFIIDIDSNVPNHLASDPTRLGQLLTNLVSNAIKFTNQGHVILSCRMIAEKQDSVILRFKVADTGIGIEKDRLDYLFDMFTQADSSTTRRFGGTGLGLTICKRIASLMGGTIEVESELGHGTTFTFQVEIQKVCEPVETVTCSRLAGIDPSILRVSVLSENTAIVKAIKNILRRLSIKKIERLDHSVLDAPIKGNSGDQASEEISCVIVDVSGKEASRIRSMAASCTKRKFVILVPFGLQEEARSLIDADNFTVTLKPATVARLAASIKGLLIPGEAGKRKEKEGTGTRFHQTNIMVVEDNEINQMVAKEILEKLGTRVEFASNGIEAIDKASPGFDVIFMDIQMPEMDGYEATKVLRERRDLSKVPIIAMTAGVFKEDRQRCFEAGMNDFVMKPVTPDSVMAVLRKWVDPQKMVCVAPEQEKTADRLPVIPGADMEEAQKRFGSNPGLYVELIERFVDEQQTIIQKVEALKREEDNSRLRRFFHTGKGVCANLALEDLRKLFHEAERAIDGSGARIEEIVRTIDDRIQGIGRIVSVVAGQAEKSTTSVSRGSSADKEIKNLLLQLDELLELNDIECEDIWKKIKEKLKGTISKKELSKLDTLIKDLEFEAARDHLAQIGSKFLH